MPPTTKDSDRLNTASSEHLTSTTVAESPAAGGSSVPASKDAARAAAICVEIPLEIHGSQKSSPGQSQPSEPFHEDTKTVIVFPHGGVVRLSAAVAPGQMIALTNQNTQRGMLCRVVSVRNYPNIKGYVEVEFTQPAEGFWGISFPEQGPAPAAASHPAPAPASPAPRTSLPSPAGALPSSFKRPAPVSTGASDQPASSASGSRPGGKPTPDDFWSGGFPQEVLTTPKKDSAVAAPPAPVAAAPVEPVVEKCEPTASKKPAEIWSELLPTSSSAPTVVPATNTPTDEPKESWQPARPAELPEPVLIPEPFHAKPAAPAAEHKPDLEGLSPAVLKELSFLEAPAAPPEVKKEKSAEDSAPVSVGHTEPHSKSPSRPAADVPLPPPVVVHEEPPVVKREFHPRPTLVPPIAAPQSSIAPRAASPAPAEPVVKPEKSDFGSFLKDPEPRGAGLRAFEGDSAAAESASPLAPLRVKRQSPGLIIGAVAATLLLVAGAGWFMLRPKSVAPQITATNIPAENPAAASNASDVPPAASSDVASASPAPAFAQPVAAPSKPAPAPTGSAAALTSNSKSGAPASNNEDASSTPSRKNAQPEQPRRPDMPKMKLAAPSAAGRKSSKVGAEQAPEISSPSGVFGSGNALGGIVGDAASSPSLPAAPASSEPIKVGGKVKEPRLISSVLPVYPLAAKQFNIQGDVTIAATIDTTGKVTTMKVLSGPAMLQRAAMDALRQWKYEPSRLDDVPVTVQTIITVRFRR